MVKDYMTLKKAEMNEKLQKRDEKIAFLEKAIDELEKEYDQTIRKMTPSPSKDLETYKTMIQKIINTIRSERLWTHPVRQVLAEAEKLL